MGDLFNAGGMTPLYPPPPKKNAHTFPLPPAAAHPATPPSPELTPVTLPSTLPELRLYVARKHAGTPASCVVTHFTQKNLHVNFASGGS